LLRIKGELLLLQDAPGAAAMAEDYFRQALGWARRQAPCPGNCAPPRALRGSCTIRVVPPMPWRSSSQSTTGSPRASTRPTSRQQKR
jgi:hypothetical protein